jgi:hypothetical protein
MDYSYKTIFNVVHTSRAYEDHYGPLHERDADDTEIVYTGVVGYSTFYDVIIL